MPSLLHFRTVEALRPTQCANGTSSPAQFSSFNAPSSLSGAASTPADTARRSPATEARLQPPSSGASATPALNKSLLPPQRSPRPPIPSARQSQSQVEQ